MNGHYVGHTWSCKCGMYAYDTGWEDLPDDCLAIRNEATEKGHDEDGCPEKEMTP